MDLYVCWTTKDPPLPRHDHPCTLAYRALRDAGYDPNVKYALSYGPLPGLLQTPARRKVKRNTGNYWVPALEADGGEWISGSEQIVAWAERNPAVPA